MYPTEEEEKSSVPPSCDSPRSTTITDQTRYAQCWHRCYESNQPFPDCNLGPLHEMKPIPGTANGGINL